MLWFPVAFSTLLFVRQSRSVLSKISNQKDVPKKTLFWCWCWLPGCLFTRSRKRPQRGQCRCARLMAGNWIRRLCLCLLFMLSQIKAFRDVRKHPSAGRYFFCYYLHSWSMSTCTRRIRRGRNVVTTLVWGWRSSQSVGAIVGGKAQHHYFQIGRSSVPTTLPERGEIIIIIMLSLEREAMKYGGLKQFVCVYVFIS